MNKYIYLATIYTFNLTENPGSHKDLDPEIASPDERWSSKWISRARDSRGSVIFHLAHLRPTPLQSTLRTLHQAIRRLLAA